MNSESSEAVKSVSAGPIVMWALGIPTILVGIGGGYIPVIIAGIILLPLTNTLVKKYVKINFSGTARFAIAVILVIGGMVASSSIDEVRQAAEGQTGTGEAAQEVFTEIYSLKGKGNQNTESFNVTGKKVRVTATTCCGSTSSGSFSGVSLEKENGGYTGPGLQISTDGSERGEGQTTYRSLSPGLYYVKVISGVNWEVKVEQVN